MDKIKNIKFISIWIFIVPFIAINACLYVSTQFTELFEEGKAIYGTIFPYIDGKASISRTARYFPTYFIFKPAMFLTSFLLIKYWLYNAEVIQYLQKDHKYKKKILFFGIASAIALTIHSIFLGIKFDNDLYKLFRRVVMLSFIVFEIVAQAYLVATFYSLKEKLDRFINKKYLKIKLFLVSTLIIVAIISIPLISLPGNKFLKHALEWDYFLGVITFYLLTFLMWKNKNN
ncbi:hypothetical protein N9K55_00075 [Candidatus Pelagibacter bacterium]|jgi:hypothetical protein|nr:hypothetical protein [Candidatus Pelagibacter bacterium]